MISYDEASYFDGYHFAHIAVYLDVKRLQHRINQSRRLIERRRGSRNLSHG